MLTPVENGDVLAPLDATLDQVAAISSPAGASRSVANLFASPVIQFYACEFRRGDMDGPADWMVIRPNVYIDPPVYSLSEVFAHGAPQSWRHGDTAHVLAPYRGRSGSTSLLALSLPLDLDGWQPELRSFEQRLLFVACHLHERLFGLMAPAPIRLAPRERDVLRLFHRGESIRAIAATLELEESTIQHYATSARKKLDVQSTRNAARRAADLGLLAP